MSDKHDLIIGIGMIIVIIAFVALLSSVTVLIRDRNCSSATCQDTREKAMLGTKISAPILVVAVAILVLYPYGNDD